MSSNNVKLYKLVSGEEVVAEEVKVSEGVTVIDNAVALVYHQTEKGVSVGFAPFMPQGDGKIELWHSAIAAVCDPNEKVKSEHLRIFTGIVLASAGTPV